MAHYLHRQIGAELETRILSLQPGIEILLDQACNGNMNLPLFLLGRKSNDTECCNVDILVLKDGKIKILIEIDESNIKPTHICGKLFTSLISEYFNHKKYSDKNIYFGDEVHFVQVVDTSKLHKIKSKKISQLCNISKNIIQLINDLPNSKINYYHLIFTDKESSKFKMNINQLVDQIINYM